MDFVITATHNSIPRVLTPLNDSFVFTDEPTEGRIDLRRRLETRLILVQGDFDWLYAIETGVNRCLPITVSFVRGSYAWSGRLNMSNLDFDLDDCRVEVEVLPNDAEDCLKNVFEARINILTATPVNVRMFEGDIEYATYNLNNEALNVNADGEPVGYAIPTDPSDTNWRFLSAQATSTNGGATWTGAITWARQRRITTCVAGVPVAPLVSLWLLRSNDCATLGTATYTKQVPRIFDVLPYILNTTTYQKQHAIPGANYISTNLRNGRAILPIIQSAVEACGLTFRSDFFNINPVGDAPSGTVYLANAPLYRNIIAFQKSDLRYPNAQNPAVNGFTTVQEMLDNLRAMMRIIWFIDGSGNFRLEHESFYSTTNGFNIVTSADFIERPNRAYSRISDDYPRFQRFQFAEDFNNRDFQGQDISYPTACARGIEQNNADVTTNLAPILIDRNVTGDDGFVWVAAQSIGGILRIPTRRAILTQDENLNGLMGWAVLHDHFHQNERYFSSYFRNNATRTALTVRPSKRQRITAGLCPATYEAINTRLLMNTPLGWGRPERVSYDYKTQIMTAEILIP